MQCILFVEQFLQIQGVVVCFAAEPRLDALRLLVDFRIALDIQEYVVLSPISSVHGAVHAESEKVILAQQQQCRRRPCRPDLNPSIANTANNGSVLSIRTIEPVIFTATLFPLFDQVRFQKKTRSFAAIVPAMGVAATSARMDCECRQSTSCCTSRCVKSEQT